MSAPMMLRARNWMPSYSVKFDSHTSMKMVVGIGWSARLPQCQYSQDHIRRWPETDGVPGYPIWMSIWHADRWHGFNVGVPSYSTVNRKQVGGNTETERRVAQRQERLKLNCSVSMFIVVYQTCSPKSLTWCSLVFMIGVWMSHRSVAWPWTASHTTGLKTTWWPFRWLHSRAVEGKWPREQ